MNEIQILQGDDIPFLLRQIPDKPNKLYVKGCLPKDDVKLLCIVGARKHSSYGEEACRKLITGLKGYNICIVSGLALGIDGIAHRTALEAGLHTIAFPGSGLNDSVLYPPTHKRLANEILYAGGALISEFDMNQVGMHWTFPQRNRLMAGISHATVIIEAKEKSGTLITARFALDYSRDVGAVPGSIFSPLAYGPNDLISDGAKIITSSEDILEILGLKTRKTPIIQKNLFLNRTDAEIKIIELLSIEPHNSEQLIQKIGLPAQELNMAISTLEIEGIISSSDTNTFKICNDV